MNFAMESFFKLRLFITSNNDPVILTVRILYGTERLLQILARVGQLGLTFRDANGIKKTMLGFSVIR